MSNERSICEWCTGTYNKLDNRVGVMKGPAGGSPYCPRCTDVPTSREEASPCNKIYICRYCSGIAGARSDLCEHENGGCIDEDVCPLCGLMFGGIDEVRYHLAEQAPEDPCASMYWHPQYLYEYYEERIPGRVELV